MPFGGITPQSHNKVISIISFADRLVVSSQNRVAEASLVWAPQKCHPHNVGKKPCSATSPTNLEKAGPVVYSKRYVVFLDCSWIQTSRAEKYKYTSYEPSSGSVLLDSSLLFTPDDDNEVTSYIGRRQNLIVPQNKNLTLKLV